MVLDEDWVCRSTFLEWVERQVSDTGGAGVPEGSEGGERLFEMVCNEEGLTMRGRDVGGPGTG